MFPPFVHGALIDAEPVSGTDEKRAALGASCGAKPDLLSASDTSSKMPLATSSACALVSVLWPPLGPVESEPQPSSAPANAIQANRRTAVERRGMGYLVV